MPGPTPDRSNVTCPLPESAVATIEPVAVFLSIASSRPHWRAWSRFRSLGGIVAQRLPQLAISLCEQLKNAVAVE